MAGVYFSPSVQGLINLVGFYLDFATNRSYRTAETLGIRDRPTGCSVCWSGSATHWWRSATETVSTGASLDVSGRRSLVAAGKITNGRVLNCFMCTVPGQYSEAPRNRFKIPSFV